MGFLGVYRAVYDYVPQAEAELAITEGDLLYILEKGQEDDWWKAKKKAGAEEEDEPVGLIPNNYIEEAQPVGRARALYEYTRQTDEELSFPEDAALQVFDTTDPDWILVGLDDEFGFVPANYIEMGAGEYEDHDDDEHDTSPPSLPARPPMPAPPVAPDEPADEPADEPERRRLNPVGQGPAAAMASVMQGTSAEAAPSPPAPEPPLLPRRSPSELSDEEANGNPALPARPVPAPISPREAPQPSVRSPDARRDSDEAAASSYRTPGGFHMYNINEMVSVMGKRKKMPTTLGINIGAKTILIAPERAQDGPSQEWAGSKMTHYSREGKHVFLELVRPSKSVDFHAGAKDTAEEIVGALGELAATIRADELPDVLMSPTGVASHSQKRGQILYDFMAQGDDEVTVAAGDDVVIIDDGKSDEWWQVRRVKNGKEGVVPSSYIEITGIVSPPASSSGVSSTKSRVEQNRLEEIRLTKEAVKAHAKDTSQQVGPGMPLPERGSSLQARKSGSNSSQQRNRRENGRADGSSGHGKASKSKPDPAKVRTWTDRSKSFSVEAQFLGVKDGKINLHKVNGVKIAVPVTKMSHEDVEYVEKVTGSPLDSDKSGSRKSRPGAGAGPESSRADRSGTKAGASVEPSRKSEYDWFQFFLDCDVNHALCERYAQAFIKESMDESILSDVDAGVLRTLGLREGDIIKVMRALDSRFARTGSGTSGAMNRDGGDDAGGSGAGGLFSGPGGALRNNTRKGRPAPAVPAGDVVDPKAFSQSDGGADGRSPSSTPASPSATGSQNAAARGVGGFDDDAWDVKPAKQAASQSRVSTLPAPAAAHTPAESPAAVPRQNLTGSLQELSLLTAPLQPAKTPPTRASDDLAIGTQSAGAAAQSQATLPQAQGASPSFFANLAPGQQQTTGQARQRPQAPQFTAGQGTLVPPPPSRPLSAPQSAQPSVFAPPAPPTLGPQMTGSVHASLQGQVAPAGQSLHEMTQARMQDQYARQLQQQQMQQMQPTPTGPYGMPGPIVSYPTGVQGQFMQPMMTGVGQMQPMQAQPTGFPNAFPQQQPYSQVGMGGGINSYLPPALEPLRTGVPATFPNTQLGTTAAPAPPAPPAPLVPQQTGPPPPVRFGVQPEAPKLVPQATGRKANLSQATPQNPFGF